MANPDITHLAALVTFRARGRQPTSDEQIILRAGLEELLRRCSADSLARKNAATIEDENELEALRGYLQGS